MNLKWNFFIKEMWNAPPLSSSAVLEPKQLTFGNISWSGPLHKSSLSKAKVLHAFTFTSFLAKKKVGIVQSAGSGVSVCIPSGTSAAESRTTSEKAVGRKSG